MERVRSLDHVTSSETVNLRGRPSDNVRIEYGRLYAHRGQRDGHGGCSCAEFQLDQCEKLIKKPMLTRGQGQDATGQISRQPQVGSEARASLTDVP